MKKNFKRYILPTLMILVGVAMIFSLISQVISLYDTKEQLSEVTAQKEELESERDQLQNEVDLLNDDEYVTRYARENYIFTKKGEKVIKIPDSKDSTNKTDE